MRLFEMPESLSASANSIRSSNGDIALSSTSFASRARLVAAGSVTPRRTAIARSLHRVIRTGSAIRPVLPDRGQDRRHAKHFGGLGQTDDVVHDDRRFVAVHASAIS